MERQRSVRWEAASTNLEDALQDRLPDTASTAELVAPGSESVQGAPKADDAGSTNVAELALILAETRNATFPSLNPNVPSLNADSSAEVVAVPRLRQLSRRFDTSFPSLSAPPNDKTPEPAGPEVVRLPSRDLNPSWRSGSFRVRSGSFLVSPGAEAEKGEEKGEEKAVGTGAVLISVRPERRPSLIIAANRNAMGVLCASGDVMASYTFGAKISESKSGSIVSAVTERSTGAQLALKAVALPQLGVTSTDADQCRIVKARCRNELEAMIMTMGCKHVLRLHDVFEEGEPRYCVYLVTERCHTSLDLMVSRDGPLPELAAAEILGQLILALRHLRSLNIVHRDIRLRHVLLVKSPGEPMLVKLGGLACAHLPAVKRPVNVVGSTPSTPVGPALAGDGEGALGRVGHLLHTAPECLGGDPASPASDLYSLGVLLFQMLTGGQVPYRPPSDLSAWGSPALGVMSEIRRGCIRTDGYRDDQRRAWEAVSHEARSLVLFLLFRMPEGRPSLEAVEADPWLKPEFHSQRAAFLSRVATTAPSPQLGSFRIPPRASSPLVAVGLGGSFRVNVRPQSALGVDVSAGATLSPGAAAPASAPRRLSRASASSGRLSVAGGGVPDPEAATTPVSFGSRRPSRVLSRTASGLRHAEFSTTLRTVTAGEADVPPLAAEALIVDGFRRCTAGPFARLIAAPDVAAIDASSFELYRGLKELDNNLTSFASNDGPFFRGAVAGPVEAATAGCVASMVHGLPAIRDIDILRICARLGLRRTKSWLEATAGRVAGTDAARVAILYRKVHVISLGSSPEPLDVRGQRVGTDSPATPKSSERGAPPPPTMNSDQPAWARNLLALYAS